MEPLKFGRKNGRRAGGIRRAAHGLVFGVLLGSAMAPVASHAAPNQLQEATISVFPNGAFQMLAYIGRDHGIFEKHGIKPVLLELTTGPLLNSAVISGQATFGGVILQGATALAFQGEEILFLTGDAGPIYNLIATKESGISSVKDLKGKRIGVTGRGAFTEFFARAVLKDAGVNPDTDVTFVGTGGVATSISAFQGGQIDALVSFPPMEPKIGEGKFTMVFNNVRDQKYFRGVTVDSYATTRAMLRKNPKLVENFCRAIWETHDFSKDPANLPKVTKTVAAVLGITDVQAAEFWKEYQGIYDLNLPEARWNAQGENIQGAFANKMPSYSEFVHKPCTAHPTQK